MNAVVAMKKLKPTDLTVPDERHNFGITRIETTDAAICG